MGVMLVYLISLTGNFQWCIRQSCETDNMVSFEVFSNQDNPKRQLFFFSKMTAVERVSEYISLPVEDMRQKIDHKNDKEKNQWPNNGEIIFENFSFSYENEKNVLKNLSLRIRPGEKIGIVGRSGAGLNLIKF
jgi:ABC-type multidrug transport system fused ATPase/permease subunit